VLRRRAVTKFGERAGTLFFTRDGLEQATRPAVAAHHAARFVAAGVTGVTDLGCGIGTDALALLDAGLSVRAVERDPATADVARANLGTHPAGPEREVLVADAESVPVDGSDPTTGWFADPARRDAAGRVWTTAGLSPSWDFVLRLLVGTRVAGVKLGPALPHADIPDGVEAEWVSHAGSTVEVALWVGGPARPNSRRATILDAPGGPATLLIEGQPPDLGPGPIGRYVYEPDGAVIRAGAIPLLAEQLAATVIDPKIAYLTGDRAVRTPFARTYEVLDQLPYRESALRSWLRANAVGQLEIKQRGIDLDPARLRRRLSPRGLRSAIFLITRAPAGAVVLVVERVSP
jgi:SAM-dependent methyltransferase